MREETVECRVARVREEAFSVKYQQASSDVYEFVVA
ncbi:predicted protein [Plenodomus lingam JN3]|uniref:Predicted protein n=1 Tax=Leptosphaeria maculans (strain JN3 / isolate v23.1.3 / race Av1-4-5-6-7-8) TaxID=985895 RepID=E5A3I6_LEPMJ|nr:predicted protein [Plenodomus lingam JN3]CBX98199.1 predicted protein [Plenodomus lingam JN3]